uniref:Uncharacterized protein n=1 Tax=Caenorhabditis japonica TaxID=281687 RepID=A0A8R1DX40_CAEJA
MFSITLTPIWACAMRFITKGAAEIATTMIRQDNAIITASANQSALATFFLSGKYFQCSLGDKPIVNKNGSPTCPLSDTGDGCDSDIAMCVNLETMGLCCNKTLELGFAADQTATCRSGKPRYLIDGDAMLGKIGEDFTCPTDYTPEEGNFFLTCCQK